MKWFCTLLTLLLVVPSHALQPVQEKPAEKAAAKTAATGERPEFEFIRLRKDGRRTVAMETNVVRYTDSIKYPGTTVDLIGAIHMADPEYYDQLNTLFETYDVVLFEAVKDEKATMEKPRPGAKTAKSGSGELSGDTMVGLSFISTLQLGMKDTLGLEYQMEGVDYTKKNFVHADMTIQEFQRTMQRRGESFGSMMLTEMGKAMQKGQTANPLAQQLDLMFSLMSSDREIRLRRIFASELVKAGTGESFADENGESAIITERNKKALQVLEDELEKGRKKIGIFYGAAHLPDMEKRLQDDFYYRRGDVKWLRAWKLRRGPASTPQTTTPAEPADK